MSKVLIAYFSATHVTEKIAQLLGQGIHADVVEIVPEERYTASDLDWTNSQSRSSLEMKDLTCRPAFVKEKSSLSGYDTVFVGFPIWWYREPSIVDTFLEAYDFEGKTVIPFATSGSSGMGDVMTRFQNLLPKSKVMEGKRFSAHVSKEELTAWADNIFKR